MALILWLLPFGIVAVGFAIVVCQDWWDRQVQRKADIIERAESQHARLMSGDDTGFYGDYPPADLGVPWSEWTLKKGRETWFLGRPKN